MKDALYRETTVVSYHTFGPSRDIIALVHQEITWEWWLKAMKRFDVFISEIVSEEAKIIS